MISIQKSTFCALLFLCSNTVFANEVMEDKFVKKQPQSTMTLASTDFSVQILEEHEGRVLIRGGRGGIRARRVSLGR